MPHLLLLPGFLCDRTVWEQQIPPLSTRAEITVMDWGTLDSLVDMAEHLLRSAPPTFAMAGHSMGGRVAFEVYRRAPERVTHIALMDTNFPPLAAGDAGAQEVQNRMALLNLARESGMRIMSKRWLQGMIPSYRQDDTALTEEIIQMFERKTPDDFERQMNALIRRPDATPVLAQIRCPALLLTGQDDGWSGPAAHEKMHAAIPGSELVLVERCGHMSTMERPAEITRAFEGWLSRS